jgi:Fe-S cluster biogenesis protein NfuA
MWTTVETAIEQMRPLITSYQASAEVLDVLGGDVTISLRAESGGPDPLTSALPDLIRRTLMSEVPEITAINFEVPSQEEIAIDYDMPQDSSAVCFLTLDRALADGGTRYYENPDDARKDKLPTVVALLALPHIVSVLVRSHVLVISRDDGKWEDILPVALKTIRKTLSPVEEKEVQDKRDRTPAEQALRQQVQALMDSQINPGLASHSGYVELMLVDNTDLHIKMGGGCQGCSSASATLSLQVATMIREELPQVDQVIDVTNHADGQNPYYSNS